MLAIFSASHHSVREKLRQFETTDEALAWLREKYGTHLRVETKATYSATGLCTWHTVYSGNLVGSLYERIPPSIEVHADSLLRPATDLYMKEVT